MRVVDMLELSLDYSGKWDTVPGQDDGGAVNLLSMLERPSFCTLDYINWCRFFGDMMYDDVDDAQIHDREGPNDGHVGTMLTGPA